MMCPDNWRALRRAVRYRGFACATGDTRHAELALKAGCAAWAWVLVLGTRQAPYRSPHADRPRRSGGRKAGGARRAGSRMSEIHLHTSPTAMVR